MPRSFEGDLNAEGLRLGIVASRFNDDIVDGLLRGAVDCLVRHGAKDADMAVYRVPGAFEIPTAVRHVIASAGIPALRPTAERRDARGMIEMDVAPRPSAPDLAISRHDIDAIIALGCLIRGDTPHFDFISAQVTQELSRVSVDAQFPVAFGVITCNTWEQAVERSSPGPKNKGWEAALAAVEMANLWRQIRTEGK